MVILADGGLILVGATMLGWLWSGYLPNGRYRR